MPKERPILFSGPMVRAILEGRKTQTRRVIKPQPDSKWVEWCIYNNGGSNDYFTETGMHLNTDRDWVERDNGECPYGAPGDRLWVRETWCRADGTPNDGRPIGPDAWGCLYRASEPKAVGADDEARNAPWRPSIFMPRWASRILLEIECVHIERVQDITEEEALREGVARFEGPVGELLFQDYSKEFWGTPAYTARDSFKTLWDSINAARGFGWEANPYVWVVSFKRVVQP